MTPAIWTARCREQRGEARGRLYRNADFSTLSPDLYERAVSRSVSTDCLAIQIEIDESIRTITDYPVPSKE